ncbi:translation elongation factor-like protein [Candidatus Woesearchaeota archaeon]|nr:translation elongation factor-like protein [Candidatus Woesearchaeota archaeon]
MGKVTHFFGKLNVGIIKLTDTVKVGDTIKIKGHTSNFSQKIDSMQINRADVPEGKAGDEIGIKVNEHVREGDTVYLAGN